MEPSVSKVESDIANIQLDVRELRGDVTDLKVAYATLEGKIDVLHEKLDALSGRVDANATAAGSKVEALEVKIDANAKSADAKFEATQKELGALRIELREGSGRSARWAPSSRLGSPRPRPSIGSRHLGPGADTQGPERAVNAPLTRDYVTVVRLTRWIDQNTGAAR